MVCCLSILQGPIQAILRPGLWFPGLNLLHSHRECWELPTGITPTQFIDMVTNAVETIQEEDEKKRICLSKPEYEVQKTNQETGFVRVLCYTRAEWLDVVEIHLSSGKALSFSSGWLPTWVPLCFIFNMLLFWFPFYDYKLNEERLQRLRTILGFNLKTSLIDPEDANQQDRAAPETTNIQETAAPSEKTEILDMAAPSEKTEIPDTAASSEKTEIPESNPSDSSIVTEAQVHDTPVTKEERVEDPTDNNAS